MHKFARKVYMSMLTVAIVCITMVATTYAWVGMLANSTFDSFDIGVKNSFDGNKPKDYSVVVSLTGEEGSFAPELKSIDLKRAILKKMGYSVDNHSDEYIEANAKTIILSQATVRRKTNGLNPDGTDKYSNDLYDFTDVDGHITKKIISFDLYISVDKIGEQFSTSDYNLDIYLKGNIFSSLKQQSIKTNDFRYPSDFINNLPNGLKASELVTGNISVKPESACRVAFQKYAAVKRGNVQLYDRINNASDLVIYEGGSKMPSYSIDESGNKIYSFGGILPDEYNIAVNDFNSMYPERAKQVPKWALERGDLEYNYQDLNQIINKEVDGVRIDTMMKMTVYFWFEGWDADCFSVIDRNPVSLNLCFTTKEKDI